MKQFLYTVVLGGACSYAVAGCASGGMFQALGHRTSSERAANSHDAGDGDGECEGGVDENGDPCTDPDDVDQGDGDGEEDDDAGEVDDGECVDGVDQDGNPCTDEDDAGADTGSGAGSAGDTGDGDGECVDGVDQDGNPCTDSDTGV